MEQDLSDFRPTRVWKRLSPERRLAAAEPFWNDEQSTEQQAEAIAAIALHEPHVSQSSQGSRSERPEPRHRINWQ